MADVLIFGDSTLDIQGLKAILGQGGYESLILPRAWDEPSRVSTPDVKLIFLDVPYLNRVKADVDAVISRCRLATKARIFALLAPDSPGDYALAKKVDDFITYPYNRHEVLARVENALGIAIQDEASGPEAKRFLIRGLLVIDQDKYEVRLGSRKIALTYKEYELLKFLASSPGKVFPRDVLLDKVWGYNYFGGTRTVDMHIQRLRTKLQDEKQSIIETVRGVGYRFAAQP